MPSIFGVPVDAAYHLVTAFTGILTPVLGGLAAVAAIVMLTIAVRLALTPLSLRALRGQAVAARLAPELQALRQRYAKQPDRFQAEMTALYRREGTSMFAGLTPILLQWPVVSVLYLLFRSPHLAGQSNTLLSHTLLGVPLGAHWLGGVGPVSLQGVVFLGAFVLLAVLCWLSARLARQAAPVPAPREPLPRNSAPSRSASRQPAPRRSVPRGSAPRGSAPHGSTPPQAAPRTGLLLKTLPYLTVVIAAFAPLAAAIYLITSTAWSLAERMLFRRSASRQMPHGPTHQGVTPPGQGVTTAGQGEPGPGRGHSTRARSRRTGGEPWASMRS